jgi:hypothetical protein
MRKTILKMALVILSVVVLILSSVVSIAAAGKGNGNVNAGEVQIIPLSEVEKTDLLFLREEEKLARDVYLQLYDTWNVTIFKNIVSSEQKHMDAIKNLLDKYGISDPALARGEFSEGSGLQDLYNTLVAQGSQSLVNALEVGVLIEEKDIEDLNSAIAATTHKDIKTVYNNLLEGSYHHLAAFISYLD